MRFVKIIFDFVIDGIEKVRLESVSLDGAISTYHIVRQRLYSIFTNTTERLKQNLESTKWGRRDIYPLLLHSFSRNMITPAFVIALSA